jgi:hypothetical protein
MDLPSNLLLILPASKSKFGGWNSLQRRCVLVTTEKTDLGWKLTVAPEQKECWRNATTNTPFQNRTVPFVTSTGEVIEKYVKNWGAGALSPDGIQYPAVEIKKHTDIFGKNVRLKSNVRFSSESDEESDDSLYSECCQDEDENGIYC